MKKLFFLFLLSFCFFKPLYAQENQNEGYILKIKKGKTIKEGSATFLEIPVMLKNTTKDTLYYLSMSCSWQDNYSVDNPKLDVEIVDCDKNVTERLEIPPSESTTVLLKLIVKITSDSNPIEFKIGFNLIRLSNTKNWYKERKEKRSVKNIIWSNQIQMRTKKAR